MPLSTDLPSTHAANMHFFWSYVYDKETNPAGWITIVDISTNTQNADTLTKALTRVLFVACPERF